VASGSAGPCCPRHVARRQVGQNTHAERADPLAASIRQSLRIHSLALSGVGLDPTPTPDAWARLIYAFQRALRRRTSRSRLIYCEPPCTRTTTSSAATVFSRPTSPGRDTRSRAREQRKRDRGDRDRATSPACAFAPCMRRHAARALGPLVAIPSAKPGTRRQRRRSSNGRRRRSRSVEEPSVLATAKHFVGGGPATTVRLVDRLGLTIDQASLPDGDQLDRAVFLDPFKQAVQKHDVRSRSCRLTASLQNRRQKTRRPHMHARGDIKSNGVLKPHKGFSAS